MNLKTNLANKANYGGARSLSNIKYLVIHYTAVDGDSDENEGICFHNNIVKASAHYFVDDDSITQSVPDNYNAYHCGAKTYKHKYCRNSNSIGIELCDNIKNGILYPTTNTIKNALELVEYLMKKYSIPKSNVIRHYDVTGKLCPAYWCGTDAKNAKWKSEFWNKLGVATVESTQPKITNTTTTTTTPTKAFEPYLVKVTASSLNVRKGVGTSHPVVTTVKKGYIYTIIEVRNGWGKLKSGIGWISLKYTQRV